MVKICLPRTRTMLKKRKIMKNIKIWLLASASGTQQFKGQMLTWEKALRSWYSSVVKISWTLMGPYYEKNLISCFKHAHDEQFIKDMPSHWYFSKIDDRIWRENIYIIAQKYLHSNTWEIKDKMSKYKFCCKKTRQKNESVLTMKLFTPANLTNIDQHNKYTPGF